MALDNLTPGIGDPGLDSFLPGIAPFAKVKFPTAGESSGLGTGKSDYGFGMEFDKQIDDFSQFSDVGYTFIGEPSNTNIRDKISAGGGPGTEILTTFWQAWRWHGVAR